MSKVETPKDCARKWSSHLASDTERALYSDRVKDDTSFQNSERYSRVFKDQNSENIIFKDIQSI